MHAYLLSTNALVLFDNHKVINLFAATALSEWSLIMAPVAWQRANIAEDMVATSGPNCSASTQPTAALRSYMTQTSTAKTPTKHHASCVSFHRRCDVALLIEKEVDRTVVGITQRPHLGTTYPNNPRCVRKGVRVRCKYHVGG